MEYTHPSLGAAVEGALNRDIFISHKFSLLETFKPAHQRQQPPPHNYE